MSEDLLGQSSPLCLLERCIETDYSSAALQTVASHFEFVHSMNVLHMHLDTWAIWRLGSPQIQIFMPSSLEIESIVAIVEIGELREEMQLVFGVKLRVWRLLGKREA